MAAAAARVVVVMVGQPEPVVVAGAAVRQGVLGVPAAGEVAVALVVAEAVVEARAVEVAGAARQAGVVGVPAAVVVVGVPGEALAAEEIAAAPVQVEETDEMEVEAGARERALQGVGIAVASLAPAVVAVGVEQVPEVAEAELVEAQVANQVRLLIIVAYHNSPKREALR